jgi:hypothetical protein
MTEDRLASELKQHGPLPERWQRMLRDSLQTQNYSQGLRGRAEAVAEAEEGEEAEAAALAALDVEMSELDLKGLKLLGLHRGLGLAVVRGKFAGELRAAIREHAHAGEGSHGRVCH